MEESHGRTCLHLAAAEKGADATQTILQVAGACTNDLLFAQDNHGQTALHKAARRPSNVDNIRALLTAAGKHRKALLDVQDEDGYSALHAAAWKASETDLRELLDCLHDSGTGADCVKHLTLTNDLGHTAESFATMLQKQQNVELLRTAQAQAESKLQQEKEAERARKERERSKSGNLLRVKDQLRYNTYAKETKELLFTQDDCGSTVLHHAARDGSPAEIREFVGKAGPDALDLLLFPDQCGVTALHVSAARPGAGPHIWTLLDLAGQDVRKLLLAMDHHGQTPLHIAAWRGCEGEIQLLLAAAGVHTKELLSLRNSTNNTPREQADVHYKFANAAVLRQAEEKARGSRRLRRNVSSGSLSGGNSPLSGANSPLGAAGALALRQRRLSCASIGALSANRSRRLSGSGALMIATHAGHHEITGRLGPRIQGALDL